MLHVASTVELTTGVNQKEWLDMLLNSIRYEKGYVEEAKLKSEEQPKDAKAGQTPVGESGKAETNETKAKSSASSSAQQDLDSCLLGDFDESDGAPDDHEEGSFDDDFDKIENLDDKDDKHQ